MSFRSRARRVLLAAVGSPWLRAMVLTVALALLVNAAVRQWDEIRVAVRSIGVSGLLMSVVAVSGAVFCQWAAWHKIGADLGWSLRPIRSGIVYGVGLTGKYVPGGVWTTLLQVEFAVSLGQRRQPMATASAYAMLITLITGGIVGIVAVPIVLADVPDGALLLLFAVVPAMVVLHPRVFGALARRVVTDAVGTIDPPRVRAIMGAVMASTVSWVLFGLHIVILTDWQVEIGPSVTGYALAWTLGFLFVIAPAGAGVRDVVLFSVLSTALTSERAIATAVLSRSLMVAFDLVAGVIALASMRKLTSSRAAIVEEKIL